MSATASAAALRLEIVGNQRGEIPARRHCDFTFPGGTIGRGEDNDLSLPDAQREIASLQAIVYVGNAGQHQISNRGGLPIQLNGQPIERGQQRAIAAGDRIDIGSYQLQLSEPAANGAMRLASASVAGDAPASVPSAIWASLDAEFASVRLPASTPAPDALHPLLQAGPVDLRPDNPLLLQEGPHDDRLDQPAIDLSQLFGPGEPFLRDHILNDTTPSVLPAREPTAPLSDAFAGTPLAFDIDTAFASRPAPDHHEPAGRHDDPLLDLIETALPLAAWPGTTAQVEMPMPEMAESTPEPLRAGEPAPLLPADASQALLEGLGLSSMHPAQLDRDHLYMAGRLLRLVTQGVIDLLAARDAARPASGRHPEGHNPFAVFPSSDGALVQLFAQPLPGFMPPEVAVEHAFVELAALQQGPPQTVVSEGRRFLRLSRTP